MAKSQEKSTEPANDGKAFETYFMRFCGGAISTTCMLILGFVLRYVFGDQAGYKVQLIIFWISSGLAGLAHIYGDIWIWMQHDGPDAPSMVTGSSFLKGLVYYLPSILVFVDISYWFQALKPVLPALILGSPTYLVFGTTIYDYTGLCKWSNDILG
jgi:hypothetical protein